jgi:hypothetical protein
MVNRKNADVAPACSAAHLLTKVSTGEDNMPQINTSLSERRRKAKFKGELISLAREDLHKHTDALFVGLQEQPGHVVTMVSPEGRAAVEKIFAGLGIEWTPVQSNIAGFPDDWREFDFVVPDIVADCKRLNRSAPELRQHLIDIDPVDRMSPDQLACLMMFSANDQGVRAMLYSERKKEFTSSIPNTCFN